MKKVDVADCEVHVLVCANERPAPRTACKDFGGMEFFQALKTKVKETQRSRTHWVTRTGCLGFCNPVGTTVAIYRKNQSPVWYDEVTMAELNTIWEEIIS